MLCIDDEPQVRQLLSVCLAHFDHQVAVAATGKEGLELFRTARLKNQPYEVVITDMGMPDIDGLQVAKAIKAESHDTPVIMMTGWGTIMREDEETPPDVDALIDKPPHIKHLNNLLQKVTDPAKHGS